MISADFDLASAMVQARHAGAKRRLVVPPAGAFCDHSEMSDHCHGGCGHLVCPCGITWDDGAEGGPFDDEEPWDPR